MLCGEIYIFLHDRVLLFYNGPHKNRKLIELTILEEAQKRVNEVKKMAESDPKNTTTTLQQSKELDLADSKISTPPPESPPKAIGKTEAKPLRDNLSKIILPT